MEEKVLLDRVLLFPVNSNEQITVNKLASSGGVEGVAAIIEPGKRAVSVSVNDTSGAAGLVVPRSHVDVLFTRTGSMAEAATTTILQDITVLSVGRVTEVTQSPATGTQTSTSTTPTPSSTQSRAVTLLVTPEQAEKVELAKNQGKISLALRNPTDKSTSDTNAPTTAVNLYDPTAVRKAGPNPFLKGRQGAPNLNWSSLTGEPVPERPAAKPVEKKEPPKPKFVVDVYRGDKHVQEIFQ
jgi:pilus assembly protein CpaB